MLYAVHQLARLAFLEDGQPPVRSLQLRSRGEEAGEHQLARVRRDVDEAAAARRQIRFGAELGDVHAALAVDLQEGEQRDVEAATLEIGELIGRGDDGIGIRGAAEGEPQQRHAAHRTLLDRPGDRSVQALLQQDARHVRGDAEAEHRGLASGELLCGAPGDDLLEAQVGQLKAVVGAEDLAADGRDRTASAWSASAPHRLR